MALAPLVLLVELVLARRARPTSCRWPCSSRPHCPITLSRVLRHPRVTHETVLGALCAYVLVGLLFAFVYLAVSDLRSGPFFAQPGEHVQSEYLYFSFVDADDARLRRPLALGRAYPRR